MVTGELKDLQVRLITKEETDLWGQYIEKYHYLGYRFIPGESLRYVALLDGIWVAIIGWGSPALKCTVHRLSFVANNVRFLIFPWVHIKNLASRILAVNLKMLCADYTRIHGHPVYLAETFVDESLYKGTCYKQANWIYLGHTKGFSKKGKHYHNNNRPKGVYLYPLSKAGKVILTRPFLPAGGDTMEDRTILSLENLQVEAIKELADYIVKEKHADYLFTVKRNQESLMNDIDALRLESFPPSSR